MFDICFWPPPSHGSEFDDLLVRPCRVPWLRGWEATRWGVRPRGHGPLAALHSWFGSPTDAATYIHRGEVHLFSFQDRQTSGLDWGFAGCDGQAEVRAKTGDSMAFRRAPTYGSPSPESAQSFVSCVRPKQSSQRLLTHATPETHMDGVEGWVDHGP